MRSILTASGKAYDKRLTAPSGRRGSIFTHSDGRAKINFFAEHRRDDALDLIRAELGLSASEAMQYVAKYYNVDAATLIATAPQLAQEARNTDKAGVSKGPALKVDRKRVLIADDYRDEFTTAEIAYIHDKTAGIVTAAELVAAGVRSMRFYETLIEESPTKARRERSPWNGDHEFYFSFPTSIQGYTKLITPKRTNGDGERIKASFLSNLYACDEREHGKRYAFGLDELPSGGTDGVAYLIEGEWETLIMRAKGYAAFTTGGVSQLARFTAHEIETLTSKGIGRVVAMFDNDEAGRKALAKFTEQDAGGIELMPFSWDFAPPFVEFKDLCEYVGHHGFDKALADAITDATRRTVTPYTVGTFTRRGVSVPALTYTIDRYASDIADDVTAVLRKDKRVLLASPTGSGKTTLALSIAQHHHKATGGRVGVLLPTQIGVSQVLNDARRYASQAGNEWHAETVGISAAEGLDEEKRAKAGRAPIVISTIDSADLIGDVSLLIVDEAHTFAMDHKFRAPAVDKVFRAMNAQSVREVLALSATPETLFCKLYGFTALRCEARRKVRYNMRVTTYGQANALACTGKTRRKDELIADVVHRAQAALRNGRRAVIRYNDIKELAKIKAALNSAGVDGVHLITSDVKKDNTRNAAWLSIVERRALPDDCTVLLATKTLDTAVSIEGTGHEVIIVNETNADAIAQFVARFRDEVALDVTLVYHKLTDAKGTRNAEHRYLDHTDRAEAMAAFLNAYGDLSDAFSREVYQLARMAKNADIIEHAKAVRRDGATWVVDTVYCYARAVQETTECTSGDCIEALAAFAKCGIMDATFPQATQSIDMEASALASIQEAIARTTAEHEALRERIVQEITERHTSFLPVIYANSQDRYLRAEIPAIAGTDQFSVSEGIDEEYADGVRDLVSFSDCEKIVARYCVMRGDQFGHVSACELMGKRKETKALEWLRILEADTSELDARGKLFQDKVEAFGALFTIGKRYTGAEIQAAARKVGAGFVGLSERTAVSLFMALFGCEGRGGKGMKYEAVRAENVASYCQRIGIAPPAPFVGMVTERPLRMVGLGSHSILRNRIFRKECDLGPPETGEFDGFDAVWVGSEVTNG